MQDAHVKGPTFSISNMSNNPPNKEQQQRPMARNLSIGLLRGLNDKELLPTCARQSVNMAIADDHILRVAGARVDVLAGQSTRPIRTVGI